VHSEIVARILGGASISQHGIRISVKNPTSLNRGVKRLQIDGRDVVGNLIPDQAVQTVVNVSVTLEAS
jgi:hypothetical protein